MILSVLNKISWKENKRRYLNIKGINTKQVAFKGPDVVQIDLTDKCNSHCLVCWLHTPLKTQKEPESELGLGVVKQFINDIAGSGTTEAIFSGGGEPFIYPGIWEVLEWAESRLRFRINTNFTLLDKEKIRKLCALKRLVSLTVSVWAGDARTYARLHGRDEADFCRVKDNLRWLNELKPKGLSVKLFSCITNLNYFQLQGLVDFAVETKCNFIEFGVCDSLPGITDQFLLDAGQLKQLKRGLGLLKILKNKEAKLEIFNKRLLEKRISSPAAVKGEYDRECARLPCYAGWLFLRLRSNGELNSCLKSHRMPIGNIYQEPFSSLWNNKLQQEFRRCSSCLPKDSNYFRMIGNADNCQIGCSRLCDNLAVNANLHKFMRYLSWV